MKKITLVGIIAGALLGGLNCASTEVQEPAPIVRYVNGEKAAEEKKAEPAKTKEQIEKEKVAKLAEEKADKERLALRSKIFYFNQSGKLEDPKEKIADVLGAYFKTEEGQSLYGTIAVLGAKLDGTPTSFGLTRQLGNQPSYKLADAQKWIPAPKMVELISEAHPRKNVMASRKYADIAKARTDISDSIHNLYAAGIVTGKDGKVIKGFDDLDSRMKTHYVSDRIMPNRKTLSGAYHRKK